MPGIHRASHVGAALHQANHARAALGPVGNAALALGLFVVMLVVIRARRTRAAQRHAPSDVGQSARSGDRHRAAR